MIKSLHRELLGIHRKFDEEVFSLTALAQYGKQAIKLSRSMWSLTTVD